MRDATKILVTCIAAFALLITLGFGLEWLGIVKMGFLEPKREAVRREVFEQTRSFNEAMRQELARYRSEYLRADDESDRDIIASTVRMRFAGYDDTASLQPQLHAFLTECNNR